MPARVSLHLFAIFLTALALSSAAAHAQDQPPAPQFRTSPVVFAAQPPAGVQKAEQETKEFARRFRLGLQGGVGLDPEIIVVGGYGTIGPIFRDTINFRPGLEIGFGELTTMLAIDLDVLYTLPGTAQSRWRAYIGAGPTIGLSHRGFEVEDPENVSIEGIPDILVNQGRFDFGDTDFNFGMNFIAGAANRSFSVELRATAWGVSTIRLMALYSFF